jgi:hypothetical protein
MYRESTRTPSNVLLLDDLDDLCCFRTDRFDHTQYIICLRSILVVQAIQDLRGSIMEKC